MGKLFTAKVGKLLTRLLGNYLTATLGKVLDIYTLSKSVLWGRTVSMMPSLDSPVGSDFLSHETYPSSGRLLAARAFWSA